MTDEDRFIHLVGLVESNNHPFAWGDHGYAVGRFQDHPSYYATWGPHASEFGGHERPWDWCFEQAARRFFRAARMAHPEANLLAIAMARHLHGQLVWTEWDPVYQKQWIDRGGENGAPVQV